MQMVFLITCKFEPFQYWVLLQLKTPNDILKKLLPCVHVKIFSQKAATRLKKISLL